jgi:hypothetical protein
MVSEENPASAFRVEVFRSQDSGLPAGGTLTFSFVLASIYAWLQTRSDQIVTYNL